MLARLLADRGLDAAVAQRKLDVGSVYGTPGHLINTNVIGLGTLPNRGSECDHDIVTGTQDFQLQKTLLNLLEDIFSGLVRPNAKRLNPQASSSRFKGSN